MKTYDEIVSELLSQMDHWGSMGYDAHSIYLGMDEIATMKNEYNSLLIHHFGKLDENKQTSMSIFGVTVVPVNKPSHINISVIKRG